jgi:hypothetical protein
MDILQHALIIINIEMAFHFFYAFHPITAKYLQRNYKFAEFFPTHTKSAQLIWFPHISLLLSEDSLSRCS